MTDFTLFVGLDVHKKTISVALVDAAAKADVRFYGTIANTPDTLRSLCRKLSKDGRPLHFCYEAGPCGYGVQRQLTRLGHRCDVVAPALIPRKVGDKVKTDRRDAMMLAQTLRAGQPIRNVAWKAQIRLSARYRKLTAAGKAGAQGRCRDRARAGRLHLGHRPNG